VYALYKSTFYLLTYLLTYVTAALCNRQSGALGSRLTGAGWGGCVVSLVPADKVQKFLSSVRTSYYAERALSGDVVNECLFATQPGDGAALFVF